MIDKKLSLKQVEPHRWVFKYLEGKKMMALDDKLYKAIDLMNEGSLKEAEELYISLIIQHPNYIDAYHHLAMLLNIKGKNKEAFNMWEKAVDIGMRCFPKNFKIGDDIIEWGFIENRPFFRAYHGLGLAYLGKHDVEKALSIFNDILVLNPDDNQGIRSLVVECNFALKKPDEVLKVCQKYSDDTMGEILYGYPLAFFQLGKKDKAEKKMKEAIGYLPLIAKELIKTRHSKPKSIYGSYLEMGGADEAYVYWERSGIFWKNTEGALEFVRESVKKYDNK
ncbi:MAG: tetratricopeptide repeat protein [Athalassotoga sp.]|uniref:tetratricopeptide repeat protein n=1 Tax=Athalassotoga sp. TaxID=2022597 RepID=UPI003CFFDEF3